MDPDACLLRFLDACHDGDREEAMDALADLGHWISTGGFLPKRLDTALSQLHAARHNTTLP